MNVFLDTNILLDVLTKREPFYNDSAVLWSLAEEKIFSCFISAISINNIYYISKKINGREYAGTIVDKILDDFEVVDLNKEILKYSRTIDFHDYEDLIQYFSAIKCNAKYLITRNKKDFPKKGIDVLFPSEFLKKIFPNSLSIIEE
jgi:predicted nucleic acid-binding protein